MKIGLMIKPDLLPAEVDALKRLQAETAAELDASLWTILDRVFKGESRDDFSWRWECGVRFGFFKL